MLNSVNKTILAASFTLIALFFILVRGHNMSKIILVVIILLQFCSLALTLPSLSKKKNPLLTLIIIFTTVLPVMILALVFALGVIQVPV